MQKMRDHNRKLEEVANFIKSSGIHEPIAKAIISGSNPLKVQGMIERLASSRYGKFSQLFAQQLHLITLSRICP